MFSYLRPHRRTPSNPTSPVPEQSHSWEAPLHPTLDHAHPQRFQDASSQDSPTKVSLPPFLLPITRVSSSPNEVASQYNNDNSRAQHWENSRANTRARDIYTSSNHQRTPFAGSQRPESAGNAAPTKYATSQYSRPQIGMNNEAISRQLTSDQSSPFHTAADLQSKTLQTGRRLTGAKLPTPPSSASNSVSTFEPVQPRSGKARLNLLNPMSLLARRRTSQAITQLSVESHTSNRTRKDFPATFDPRIRGTVVHDFSAPRQPRRNVSYNDVRTEDNSSNGPRPYQRSPNIDENSNGPRSGENRTPVFTENFEEEQYPAAGPNVRRASDLSDLTLPKPPYAKGAQKSTEQFSRSESKHNSQTQFDVNRKISTKAPASDVGPPVPPKLEGELPKVPRRISIDPTSTPPKSTASFKNTPSRHFSEVSDKDAVILAVPKHMKSTSSRFSFDMIGAAEQERLLEDRHRQKALEKKSDVPDEQYDDTEDYYDYDNMDHDDGLEERIPGVNADANDGDYDGLLEYDDELEERIPGVNTDSNEEDDGAIDDRENIARFSFLPSSLASPLSPYTPGMANTPRDVNGEVIGFAMTKNSPYVSSHMAQGLNALPAKSGLQDVGTPINSRLQGLGLQGVDTSSPVGVEVQGPSYEIAGAREFPVPATIDDDDLYFDDGIIDELGDDAEAVEFDESVFDNVDTDQYGRPLNSFSSLPTLYSPPTLTTDPSPSFNKISEADEFSLISPAVTDNAVSLEIVTRGSLLAPQPSNAGNEYASTALQSHGLTQDTLAAYQSALAAAAHAAAANGKFRRDSTPAALSHSEQEDPHPSLIPDSGHASHYEPFSPSYELEDDFDYDDALEDDPIIAAANAEALASDHDGFYSQEFGFYSAPSDNEAEYANGGYFGPRGIDGVTRSQSGRVVSREPNLTPITERSEYSNRNSFMSPMHGPGSAMSPGLSQLAGMMSSPEYDGDISLNALLKLRRGAWGGSQASLHSSTGSPRSAGGEESSPVTGTSPWAHSSAVNPADGRYRRQNNGFFIGVVSQDTSVVQSENSSAPASPTLTMPALSLQANDGDGQGREEKEKDKEVRKHRHNLSSESISYLKEDDPLSPSGERWILERRRTGDSGEVEFLGREIVSGGRI